MLQYTWCSRSWSVRHFLISALRSLLTEDEIWHYLIGYSRGSLHTCCRKTQTLLLLLIEINAVAELIYTFWDHWGCKGWISLLFLGAIRKDNLWLVLFRIDIENTLLLVLIGAWTLTWLSKVCAQTKSSVSHIRGWTRHRIGGKHFPFFSINRYIERVDCPARSIWRLLLRKIHPLIWISIWSCSRGAIFILDVETMARIVFANRLRLLLLWVARRL